jgi:hypothetical protein
MQLVGVQTGPSLNRSHPLARGLVGCWKVMPQRRGGVTWQDLCERNNGTLTNASTPTAWSGDTYRGGFGSIAFDGTDDYVNVPSGFTRTIAGLVQFSITLWFKANSFSNSPLIYTIPNGAGDLGFLETNSTGSQLFWGVRSTAAAQNSARTYTSTVTGGWRHVAVVKTAAGDNGNLYLDGVLQTSYTGTLYDNPSTASDILFGKYSSAGLEFNGNLDDIRFYDRALSADEAKAIYREPNAVLNYRRAFWDVPVSAQSALPLFRHHYVSQGIA